MARDHYPIPEDETVLDWYAGAQYSEGGIPVEGGDWEGAQVALGFTDIGYIPELQEDHAQIVLYTLPHADDIEPQAISLEISPEDAVRLASRLRDWAYHAVRGGEGDPEP